MAYEFYNPNPNNSFVGDCVVRAISKAMDIDWDSAYLGVTMQGYMLKDMPSSDAVWGAYLKENGFSMGVVPIEYIGKCTVRSFSEDNPEGTYILATGNHVVPVKNGTYFDAGDSGDVLIMYYWKKEE